MGRRTLTLGDKMGEAGVICLILLLFWLWAKGVLLTVLLWLGGIVIAGVLLVILCVVLRKVKSAKSLSNDALTDDPTMPAPPGAAADNNPRRFTNIPAQPIVPALPNQEVESTPRRFSHTLLLELEWKRFEQLVEGYFAKTGWNTRLNRTGADGGVDVHLFKPEQSGVAAVVQCKSWYAYNVGVKPVRELFGVMAGDGVPEGYFVTTGDYTAEARSFAAGKPMTLIDGVDLLKRIEALPPEHQIDLYVKVTTGDYTTPTCPQCGVKMVRRTAGKGLAVGSEFWGCQSYPRCRQTLSIRKDNEKTVPKINWWKM